MRFLIVGGNAAGMSAAAHMKRKMPKSDVTVLEKSFEVSYGACGLPYYIAGLNDDLGLVRIRSADEFEKAGVHVRLGHAVERVDYTKKLVFGTKADGSAFEAPYDRLLIASGASPRVPNLSGAKFAQRFHPQNARRRAGTARGD
jgi:NADPH-dependent 2,4-dienoyl-CoA reductase/sulfur reductase-like enzyme